MSSDCERDEIRGSKRAEAEETGRWKRAKKEEMTVVSGEPEVGVPDKSER